MYVTVWTAAGAIRVSLPTSATIADLKALLVEYLGYDPSRLEISYGGRYVRDEVRIGRFPPDTLVAEGPRYAGKADMMRRQQLAEAQRAAFLEQQRREDEEAERRRQEALLQQQRARQRYYDPSEYDDFGFGPFGLFGAPRPRSRAQAQQRQQAYQQQQQQKARNELAQQQRRAEKETKKALRRKALAEQRREKQKTRLAAVAQMEEARAKLQRQQEAIRKQQEELAKVERELLQKIEEARRAREEEDTCADMEEGEEEEEEENESEEEQEERNEQDEKDYDDEENNGPQLSEEGFAPLAREHSMVIVTPHLARMGLDEAIHRPEEEQPSPASSHASTPRHQPINDDEDPHPNTQPTATDKKTKPQKEEKMGSGEKNEKQQDNSEPTSDKGPVIVVKAFIAEFGGKIITISVPGSGTVSDLLEALRSAEPEATRNGLRIMFCEKYLKKEDEILRSVPIVDGSSIDVCTGKYLDESEMALILAERKLENVKREISSHTKPFDKFLVAHWHELLMKALALLDSLQDVPDDVRTRRKVLVKAVMAEQDALLEN